MKVIKYWSVVIFWCCVIWFFSSIPYLKIEELGFWDFVLRKFAHITEFFVLTTLLFRAIKNTMKVDQFQLYFWSIFLSFIYSVIDELHQHFVAGRYCSPIDVMIDSLGIVISAVAYKIFLYQYL